MTSYCRNCGKKLDDSVKFCGDCGTNIRGENVHPKTEAPQINYERRKSGLGLKNIFFLFIVLYAVLNIWALTQLQIDTSAESMVNSIGNFGMSNSLTNTDIETTIRVKNPTIIPVIVPEIDYDLTYSGTQIGEGNTEMVFITSNSYSDTPATFRVSHVNTGLSVLKGIWNAANKDYSLPELNFYANLGITKISLEGGS